MANLRDTLAQVREKIARFRGSRLGEQATKLALINPVLRALRWDVEDPDEVQSEYKPQRADKPVDYALFVRRDPKLLVEAKALGENLDDRKWANQIMSYAFVGNVKWVVLTDGDEYRIYNTRADAEDARERLFRTVRISNEPSRAEEILDLLSKGRMEEKLIDAIWETHVVDQKVKGVIDQLFRPTDPDRSLVNLIRKRAADLSRREIKASLGRVRLHPDFPVEPEPEKPSPGKMPISDEQPFQPGSLKAMALDALRDRPEGMTRSEIEEAVLKKHQEVGKRVKRVSVTGQTRWMIRQAPERGVTLEIITTEDGERVYRLKSEATSRVAVEPSRPPTEVVSGARKKREGFRTKERGLSPDVKVKDLIDAGLIALPLELEKTYKGRRVTARIEADGKVACSGKSYDSLSVAAGAARQTIIGGRKPPSTNGWTFWHFKDEKGEALPVDVIRQRFLKGKWSPGT